MALVQCKDCGGKLSTEAEACPHCGRPNRPAPAPPAKPKSSGSKGLGCLVVIGVVMLLAYLGSVTDDRPKRTAPRAEESSAGARSARSVYAAADANVRSGPSTSSPIVRRASKGERLAWIEKREDWYKIEGSAAEREQWIHESVVHTAAEKSMRDSAKLRLGEWSWQKGYGYATAEGQVTNVSGEALKNVEAVVTFQTDAGEFITSDSALIEYNPLLPGQTSPWRVSARWNPEMKRAYVEFKTLFGGTLPAYRE